MRKIFVTVFMVLSFAGWVAAQVPTSGNVFFGYSYYNSRVVIDRASLNGWEGSLEGKVIPHVGIVADFSGHYGSQDFPICPVVPVGGGGGGCATTSATTHELNVMFGPRASFSMGRWTPFVQGLFGVAHISSNGFGSNTSFAMALGGGLDYRIVKPVAWRFQLDYVRTQLTLAGFSSGLAQHNFRFSTGIVLRFWRV